MESAGGRRLRKKRLRKKRAMAQARFRWFLDLQEERMHREMEREVSLLLLRGVCEYCMGGKDRYVSAGISCAAMT